jgi:hypothetical protein
MTCAPRMRVATATLESWEHTDWPATPYLILDRQPEMPGEAWGSPNRAARIVGAYARMLVHALEVDGPEDEWMLFLEDDLTFHPRLGSLLRSWPALRDPRCGFASLFNPSLHATSEWGEMDRAFAARPEAFVGGQAILLRRSWVVTALDSWNSCPGMQAQRLARMLGPLGPIWVHRPSLVQHVGQESSWGAQTHRAPDYDEAFTA